jgi:hypothetical protein
MLTSATVALAVLACRRSSFSMIRCLLQIAQSSAGDGGWVCMCRHGEGGEHARALEILAMMAASR